MSELLAGGATTTPDTWVAALSAAVSLALVIGWAYLSMGPLTGAAGTESLLTLPFGLPLLPGTPIKKGYF